LRTGDYFGEWQHHRSLPVQVSELTRHVLTTFVGLEQFRDWATDAPDDCRDIIKFTNAYWTRLQIAALVRPELRKFSLDLIRGHLKPNFPSFPFIGLTIELVSFWEFAGCLGARPRVLAVKEDAVEVASAEPGDRRIWISSNGSRVRESTLRWSMCQRLQGSVT
jgi:hypothetical protein